MPKYASIIFIVLLFLVFSIPIQTGYIENLEGLSNVSAVIQSASLGDMRVTGKSDENGDMYARDFIYETTKQVSESHDGGAAFAIDFHLYDKDGAEINVNDVKAGTSNPKIVLAEYTVNFYDHGSVTAGGTLKGNSKPYSSMTYAWSMFAKK